MGRICWLERERMLEFVAAMPRLAAGQQVPAKVDENEI
jgi:hypothetical protein